MREMSKEDEVENMGDWKDGDILDRNRKIRRKNGLGKRKEINYVLNILKYEPSRS